MGLGDELAEMAFGPGFNPFDEDDGEQLCRRYSGIVLDSLGPKVALQLLKDPRLIQRLELLTFHSKPAEKGPGVPILRDHGKVRRNAGVDQ